MFSLATILNSLAVLMSLTTATGIVVHDTHIDGASSALLSLPSVAGNTDDTPASRLTSDLHTHIERLSFSQAVRNLQGTSPRLQPRNEDKKYAQQKNARGYHPFDAYTLPLD